MSTPPKFMFLCQDDMTHSYKLWIMQRTNSPYV